MTLFNKNNFSKNNPKSLNQTEGLYFILICFFFLIFFMQEIDSSICYCKGIPLDENTNLIGDDIEIPLPETTDTPFIQSVLRLTNIARVFITSTFINIVQPIFNNFPEEFFREALFPLEYANELMRFEPSRSNQYIFEHTQTFIEEQVVDMNPEYRSFMLNNVIVNPEQCQTIIEDFREVCDTSLTIHSPSSSVELTPVSSPRN